MSGAGSTSVAVGYGGYRPPFTQVQWQELEHQAMIYKYMVAGLPVPPDLVMPIRRSFEVLSARFFNHPSLGYCSYYGKKFDPEPGRCRRTDGKKWRCSKDAHPDSKYCERHMHRGRNRSRKPVESQSATSQPISTAMSLVSTGCSSKSGSFQGNGNGSFLNIPMYSVGSSEGSSFGNNVMQMEPIIYGVNNNKEFSFSPDASGSVGNLGLGTSAGNASWRLMPSQVSSQNIPNAFEPIDSTTISKQRQQHCFFGNEIGLKQEQQQPVHPFFSEWPSTKESWSNLDDDDGSNTNVFSSTQLSISTPRASDFSPRSAYSPKEA